MLGVVVGAVWNALPTMYQIYKRMITHGIRNLLLVSTFLFFVATTLAQPTVERHLSRDSVQVGDSVMLTLRVETQRGAEIHLPQLADTLGGGVELYDRPYLDTLQYDGKAYIAEWKLPLVSYDTGWLAVPDIPLLVMYNGRADTITTGVALLLHVAYVPLSEEIGELADIRGPIAQSITFRELLPWLLALFAALLVALGIYFWLRFRKKAIHAPETPKDTRPPKEIALSLLNDLNQREAWRSPGVKYFYTGLTDALRGYLAATWGVRTLEETTAEILEALRSETPCTVVHLEQIRQVLQRSDLVKFARFEPTETEARTDGAVAVRIVEEIAAQVLQEQKKELENMPQETASTEQAFNSEARE